MSGMQGGFKGIQQGGPADAVDTQPQTGHDAASGGGMTGEDHLQRVAECRDMGGYLIGRQPGGHLHRERNQQHDIADHCRVEGVMAQASVQLLGNDYGKGSAEHHHPPRGQWRNTHRQQQAGGAGRNYLSAWQQQAVYAV